MSDIESGLFGDVSNAVKAARLGDYSRQSVVQSASRAAFYDRYVETFVETQDEQLATKLAQDSADYVEDEVKEMIKRRKQQNALTVEDQDDSVTDEIADSQAVSETPPESSVNESEEDPIEDIPLGEISHRKFSKFQNILRVMSSIKPAAATSREPEDLQRIREVHRKLNYTVAEYDSIMDTAMDDTVYAIENEFKKIVVESEAKLRQTLRVHYEKRIDHYECNQTIASLNKELEILKKGFESLTNLSKKLKSEVDELRMSKSNSETEMELMAKKLTKRKMECQILRKENLELRAQLLQSSAPQGKMDLPKKLATNTVNCSESELSRLVNKKDSDFCDTSDANRTAENSCDESDDAENIPVETLYKWFDAKDDKKPKWSRVHVSQKAWDAQGPYSIMHTVDTVLDAEKPDEKNETSVTLRLKDEFLKKIHKKCRKENKGLRKLLEHEREQSKKLTSTTASKYAKSIKLTNLLQLCISELSHKADEQNRVAMNSFLEDDIASPTSESKIKLVNTLYEKKALIHEILHGLGNDETFIDAWSASDREDKQSNFSRPPSAMSSKRLKPSEAPVISVSLNISKKQPTRPKSARTGFKSVEAWVKETDKRSTSACTKYAESRSDKFHYRSMTPSTPRHGRKERPMSGRTVVSVSSVRFASHPEEIVSDTYSTTRPVSASTLITKSIMKKAHTFDDDF